MRPAIASTPLPPPGRIADPRSGPAARRAREGHTEPVLSAMTWAIRIAACVLIGVLTFAVHPPSGADLALEVLAFIVAASVMAYWLRTDLVTPDRTGPTLIAAVAVMAAAAGVTASAPRGSALIGFTVMAVLAAGTDTAWLGGWTTLAVAVVSFEAGVLVYGGSGGYAWGCPVLLLVVFVGGRNRRAYRVQAHQSAALVVQLEELRIQQQQVATLEERTRIAREIHDVLAHSLGALSIHLQATGAVLQTHDVDRARTMVEQGRRMATDGLVDTRRAVQALRGDIGDLDRQLAALVQAHQERHGATVDLVIDGDHGPLGPETTVALIRTAQEGLVNAAKHAPYQPIHIRLGATDERVTLTIANRFAGAPAPARGSGTASTFSSVDGGYGLVGMRERLLLIDGSLITGSDGDRWTVLAEVPRVRASR